MSDSVDFLNSHSDLECCFYDRELKTLDRDFNSLYETFRRIKKRVERKDTVKVSKSVFDWANKVDLENTCPQNIYQFHYFNELVTVEYQRKEDNYIVHSAYTPLVNFNVLTRKYSFQSADSIVCDRLEDAKEVFLIVVREFCLRYSCELL